MSLSNDGTYMSEGERKKATGFRHELTCGQEESLKFSKEDNARMGGSYSDGNLVIIGLMMCRCCPVSLHV